MRVCIDIPQGMDAAVFARPLLMVVVGINVAIMRSRPIPPLYESGVVYREEPPGVEEFANCLQVLGLAPRVSGIGGAWGDCDDVIAYRMAELLVAGERATPRIMWPKDKPKRKHAQIRREDGTIEESCITLLRLESERKEREGIGCNPYF